MVCIVFVSKCLKCFHGEGFPQMFIRCYLSPKAPLGPQPLSPRSAGEGVLVCAWAPLGAEVFTWDGVASAGGGLTLGLPLERTTRLPGGTSASLTGGSAGTCCCFLHRLPCELVKGQREGGWREEGPMAGAETPSGRP